MLPDTVHGLTLTGRQGDRELTTHPVAVETPAGLLVIDAGLPGQTDDLVDALAAAGADLGGVCGVVVTHQDPDHAGCLAAFRERVADVRGTPPTVYAHVADAPYVDGRAEPIKSDGDRYPPTAVDVELVGGTVFRTDAGPMRVVETPGHTPGHVSLYLPDQKLLLAADALTVTDGELAGPPEGFTPNTATALDSVAELAELTFESVVCFHGGVVAATAADAATVADDA
ncbi:MAG: Zn-dependent hydrolase [halophilic archaeon J07HB67]|jgi:Zn-dependent hydrolases, including glyoxylases|nr:MAG: Zn-dependent hydrolase [halophilic archaeon J07HB67]